MDSAVIRTTKRFASALTTLQNAIALQGVAPDVQRDTTLLRFQLTAELMPKVLQRVLSEKGGDVVLPKEVIRAATGAGIIDEPTGTTMLAVIDDRNRMVHDYSEEYAQELYQRVTKTYAEALRALLQSIEK